MLYGFASGTVACEATVSSRSLQLGTFCVRDERDSGEKVPGGGGRRETADGCIRGLRDHVILTILY